MRPKISLQINVSASDLDICKKLLERQISFWYDELDEIVLSIESKKSFGKFAKGFDENKKELMALIEYYGSIYSKVRLHFIDYSAGRSAFVSDLFFHGEPIPGKDYRGGAFYAYLDGLAECKNRYVIHIDSDMLIGGDRNSWLEDAVELLDSDPSYLFVNPLAGPPAANFDINQKYLKKIGHYTFVFDKMSTRIFLTDMEKLRTHKLTLTRMPLSVRNIKWYITSRFHWGYRGLEEIFSRMMRKDRLFRVDTLGKNETKTCFSLHPVVKPAHFIKAIPGLLKRMDIDDIPDAQRGNYNICDDFFDFQKENHG